VREGPQGIVLGFLCACLCLGARRAGARETVLGARWAQIQVAVKGAVGARMGAWEDEGFRLAASSCGGPQIDDAVVDVANSIGPSSRR
jgi:hypothetical protein